MFALLVAVQVPLTELIVRVGHFNLEALKDQSNVDKHLLFSKSSPNTCPFTITKRSPCSRWDLFKPSIQHTLRLEVVRVFAPDSLVMVKISKIERNSSVSIHFILSTNNCSILLCMFSDYQDWAKVAECLFDAGINVLELTEVLEFNRVVSEDLIYLLLCLMKLLWVAQQVVEQEGQRARGSFVTGNLFHMFSLLLLT